MRKINKGKKIIKKKKINALNIFIILFAVYFIFTVSDQQVQLSKYNSQIDMYESDVESKKELIKYYEKQRNSVETDEYIENVARENLGYVKPYEKIFIDANK